MTHKSPRVQELVAGCQHPVWDARYVGYFACFHRQLYYEAHDVLEDLWLEQGRGAFYHAYYKGLIQLAGAFVHMKLHRAASDHPVHGARLQPAARLLRLAVRNMAGYSCPCQGLDLAATQMLVEDYCGRLEQGNYQINPWSPDAAPVLAWAAERY